MIDEDAIFDFHESTPRPAATSREVFDAYLKCKDAIKSIPKAHRGDERLAIGRLLKEELRKTAEGKPLFRKNPTASDFMARFWLSRVREAASFYVAWKELPKFNGIEKSFLNDFARLSVDPKSLLILEDSLSKLGVILVHEPAIPGMKVDGACFLLETGHPVVALSLRYSRLDIYWFVLLHELSHIVLHYDSLKIPIIDNIDEEAAEDIEVEANMLAANSLIPRTVWRSASVKYKTTEEELNKFSAEIKTHPAIVAGRLQHELKRHDIFAKVVNQENSRKIIFGHE